MARTYGCTGPNGPPYGKVGTTGYAPLFNKIAANIKAKPADKACFEKQASLLFSVMTKNDHAAGLDPEARDKIIAATKTGKADLEAYCKIVSLVGSKNNKNCKSTAVLQAAKGNKKKGEPISASKKK